MVCTSAKRERGGESLREADHNQLRIIEVETVEVEVEERKKMQGNEFDSANI